MVRSALCSWRTSARGGHQSLCRKPRKERTQEETSLRGVAAVQKPTGRPALQLGAMGGERVSGTTLGPVVTVRSLCRVTSRTWWVARVTQEDDECSLEMC